MSQGSSDIVAGTTVGPYRVISQLGRGAQARVFLVEDRRGKRVALKVRRRLQDVMDRRFLREFESMRLLRLPGVVQVYEAGVDGENLWFSMDLVEGDTFIDSVRPLIEPNERVARVVLLAERMCSILASLHEAGFVHRDVKPSNVMVDAAGDVRVLDFGIGRYFSDSDTLSHSGEVLGTVPFMSPEQLAGLPIDSSVDLYAVGIMIYEAIDGPRPRPATTIGWIPRICLERLVPLACKRREVPLLLSHLVERLLHVDPDQRPNAREAADALRQISLGKDAPIWPEPPFVDPGEFWTCLEGALGRRGESPVWVVQGPAGSGRTRLAEQIHRHGLMQGFLPVHLRCAVDAVGGPLEQLLSRLLAVADEDVCLRVLGDDIDLIRSAWPQLPLPPRHVGSAMEPPSDADLAAAVARVVQRAAIEKELLILWHALERVDPLTARTIPLLVTAAGPRLGMLLVHETRWSTLASQTLVTKLIALGAGLLDVPPQTPTCSAEIITSLAPETASAMTSPVSAQLAVEAGWKALAKWRGASYFEPDASLWALACRDAAVPIKVYNRIAGRRNQPSAWVTTTDEGVMLNGPSARAIAQARLAKLDISAETLARTWQNELGDQHRPGELAVLWLLGAQPQRAWEPAARAALTAERQGRYSEARRRLMLLRALPDSSARTRELDFALAVCEARVALRTDVAVREGLVDRAEAMAATESERQLCRLMRAEVAVRQGEQRSALVTALRVAAGCAQPGLFPLGTRALLLAVACRLALGQLEDAARDLDRAERLLEHDPDTWLTAQLLGWRSELRFRERDLAGCRATCLEAIRVAGGVDYVRGVAFASARLGQVLRMLGRRRDAEHQTRSAREAFQSTGDVVLDAETGLALAVLLCERGESVGARVRLDEATRRIRSLRLDHLLPTAIRVALQVATLQANLPDANVALDAMRGHEGDEPEIAATLVRWWRTQGDVVRALAEPGPTPQAPDTFGHTLWRIERARAALAGGMNDEGLADVSAAIHDADRRGYDELATYARLIRGALEPHQHHRIWDGLLEQASHSLYTEIYLGAIEMDARRFAMRDEADEARRRWQTLLVRSTELGYRPGVEEAVGWLGELPTEGDVTDVSPVIDMPTEKNLRRSRLARPREK